MAIVWTQDLATGSAKRDMQHKAIFVRINAMLEACNQGKGKPEVNNVIMFLEDYVASHFSTEEQYMQQHGYAGYAAHKEQHNDFTVKLDELKRRIEREGVGVHTVIATNQLIVSWFVNHIRKVDVQLGSFLKDRSQPRRIGT